MVLVSVFTDIEEQDGHGQRTVAYYNVDGTNTTTSVGFDQLTYQEYYVYANETFSRVPVPNPTTPTAYSSFRFTSRGFFFFKGITIPQGSVIQDATLSFRVNVENANYQTFTGTVFGRKTASPTPYTSAQIYDSPYITQLWTKPLATAQGTFQISYDSDFQSKQSDVTAIVQELVDAFDYDNDNMMFMIQQPNLKPLIPPATVSPSVNETNTVYIDAYETGNEPFTNLTINYVIGGQSCKPISDISNAGAWEDTSFGNSDTELWNELDEEQPDGTNSAVRSVVAPTTGDTFEVKLEPCTDPVSSTNHSISINARGNGNQVKIQLFQGAGLIAESGEFTLIGAFQTFTYNLSGGEIDSITDYTDLRIRVVPSEVP